MTSIQSLLRPESASKNIALQDLEGSSITYNECAGIVDDICNKLEQLGIKRGTRVVTLLGNTTLSSLVTLAVIERAICCPLAITSTAHEYLEQCQALEADVLLCSPQLTDTLQPVAEFLDLCLVEVCWSGTPTFIEFKPILLKEPHILTKTKGSVLDYCLILLTSGSTGQPKRVGLSIDNLLHSAREVSATLQLSSSDICLAMWEQHHIGGVVDVLLAPLVAGSSILSTHGYSNAAFRDALLNRCFTWVQCVPTTLREMVRTAKQESWSQGRLRLIRSVASSLSAELQEEAETTFLVPVLQTYGMTEASPLITSNLLDIHRRRHGSVGVRLSTEICIETGKAEQAENGYVGEILIRGSNVITAYDDPSSETRSCFSDGWFRTGDLGYFDSDGFLWITGRVKQQINRGGEKISPKELEDCACECKGVDDAHAYSLEHQTLGQVPALLVASRSEDFDILSARLKAFFWQRLSPFKHPAKILFIKQLPRTSTGKLLRSDILSIINRLENQAHDSLAGSEDDKGSFLISEIAKIWAREIGISRVGADDDFIVIGGDSLSSIKVVFACEQAFNVTYPSKEWPEMTTVRRMAAVTERLIRKSLLINNRSAPPKHEQHTGTVGNQNRSDIKSDIEFAVSTGIVGNLRIDELDIKQLTEYLGRESRSMAEIQAAVERKRNLWTSDELHEFIVAYKTELALSCSDHTVKKAALHKYLARLEKQAGKVEDIWQSTGLHPGVRFYKNTSTTNSQIIIGFGGFFNRMMMPMHAWLDYIRPLEASFLFLWDENRSYYNQGIKGFAANPGILIDELSSLITSLAPSRTIGLGVSMGGYPCAAVSASLNWNKSLIICPDFHTKHPPYHKILGKSGPSPMTICYGELNSTDKEAALSLSDDAPHSRLISIPGCSNHNLLWHLHQQQLLSPFLSQVLAA